MNHKDNIFISKHDYQNMIKHEHSNRSLYFDKGFGVNDKDHNLDTILKLSDKVIVDQLHYDFKDKTCAIVGNASSVLENEYGKYIDTHDVVVRFNHSQTNGYEIHVGTKTTFRIISAKIFGYKECETLTSFNSNFIPSLKNEHFILKSDMNLSPRYLVGGLINNINGSNKVSIVHPSFQKTMLESFSAEEPSSGFFAINLFLSVFNSIDIFGFDFYKDRGTTEKLHYFENVKDQSNVHNFSNEQNVVEYLELIGRIKRY